MTGLFYLDIKSFPSCCRATMREIFQQTLPKSWEPLQSSPPTNYFGYSLLHLFPFQPPLLNTTETELVKMALSITLVRQLNINLHLWQKWSNWYFWSAQSKNSNLLNMLESADKRLHILKICYLWRRKCCLEI